VNNLGARTRNRGIRSILSKWAPACFKAWAAKREAFTIAHSTGGGKALIRGAWALVLVGNSKNGLPLIYSGDNK
jgi:hypothetical protein